MSRLIAFLPQMRKALFAGVAAFAVPFGSALTSSSEQGTTVTTSEWVTALVAALVVGIGTFGVKNAAKDPAAPAAAADTGTAATEG